MLSDKIIRLAVLFVTYTIPLHFGARLPLTHGGYSGLLLLLSGSVLIFRSSEYKIKLYSPICLFPALLIVYVFVSSISLPLPILEILSPTRAESLKVAKELAGVVEQDTALSYYAPKAAFYATYALALWLYFHLAVPALRTSKSFLRQLLWAITIVGSFEAMYGLLQVMNPEMGVLGLPGTSDQFKGCARGTIVYRNQYALFLNLCWPIAVALGLSLYSPVYTKYRSRLRRRGSIPFSQRISIYSDKAALPLFCSAVMMLAIVFSQSRGGIITMVIIGIIFALLLPTSRKYKLITICLIIFFLSIYGAMIGGYGDVVHRFSQFIAGAEGRLKIWIASLAMLQSHLFTGIGMGGYEFLSLLYLEGVPEKIWFDRAHNEYLELAIELGLPIAIMLYLWFAVGVYRFFMQAVDVRKKTGGIRKMSLFDLSVLASFSSLIAFIIHGFVDFVWRLPVNVFFVVTLVAVLSSAKECVGKVKVKKV